MPIGTKIEYEDASAEVRAVYDDMMETRKLRWIADFWKVIAQDPATVEQVGHRHFYRHLATPHCTRQCADRKRLPHPCFKSICSSAHNP